ncbi:NAD+ kinase [Cordyceps militaris CM01]|uniref:NAD+ kinase n=2 Tax=Cordyceps militaris TaxID=73501 RepID=G3JKJ5_CORMM|nr:NAD+ kinase [Cordyceps militaris CM01]ATY58309.1 NAD+ kinase [Cordyceps militaris]EGX91434.1 NAD+ kinase [Cordyceps militaris CM01]
MDADKAPNEDKRPQPTDKKHDTVFDDCSDGSDEECKAVEVVFDPSNPYRRKSSLVSSEHPPRATIAVQRRPGMVQQYLESQRHGNEPPPAKSYQAHPVLGGASSQIDGSLLAPAPAPAASSSVSPAAPSTHSTARRNSRAVVDLSSLDSGDFGQSDQQDWTREMMRSASEVDFLAMQQQHHQNTIPGPREAPSRMLTKKQLSDMAWGVRELSRRLSSMRIRVRVKSILILTKLHDQDLIPHAKELASWLLSLDRNVKYVVYIQDKLRDSKKFNVDGLLHDICKRNMTEDPSLDWDRAHEDVKKRLRPWDEDMCRTRPHIFDFVITLGGDGTVLYASWLFQRIVPPVLSFALGSLGFLTKFDFEEYAPTLTSAFTKGVTVSLRLRFESTVMRSIRRKKTVPKEVDGVNSGQSGTTSEEEDEDEKHKKRDLVEELIGEEREDAHTHRPDGTYEILNEVVVDRGPNPTMSSTELFGDDEHFTSILADGICVSTPTGSTAYNLAAGGSLCHPENPVMLVTSVCAHTLSFRPIILPDTIVLRVGVPYAARTSSWASFDGRERVELEPGDYVTISASRYPFASVQTEGRRSEDWVNSISGKLGWNTRQKQKEFKEWDK